MPPAPRRSSTDAVRRWVRGLTVVLANGDVLRVAAGPDDGVARGGLRRRDVRRTNERCRFPRIRMPDVPKCSAGYFSAPGMDLVDLFVGSEGTLGVIVGAELAVQRRPPGVCWILAPLPSEAAAIVDWLGDSGEQRTLDVAAIEHIDRRSIDVLREDGVDRRFGIEIPRHAEVLLLIQLELSAAEAGAGTWQTPRSSN